MTNLRILKGGSHRPPTGLNIFILKSRCKYKKLVTVFKRYCNWNSGQKFLLIVMHEGCSRLFLLFLKLRFVLHCKWKSYFHWVKIFSPDIYMYVLFIYIVLYLCKNLIEGNWQVYKVIDKRIKIQKRGKLLLIVAYGWPRNKPRASFFSSYIFLLPPPPAPGQNLGGRGVKEFLWDRIN